MIRLRKFLIYNFEVYTVKRLKQKLQEHYQEFIFFAEVEGRGNVVCFKNMAKYIINEKWYSEKKANIEDEAELENIIQIHIQQMMTFSMLRKVYVGMDTYVHTCIHTYTLGLSLLCF